MPPFSPSNLENHLREMFPEGGKGKTLKKLVLLYEMKNTTKYHKHLERCFECNRHYELYRAR